MFSMFRSRSAIKTKICLGVTLGIWFRLSQSLARLSLLNINCQVSQAPLVTFLFLSLTLLSVLPINKRREGRKKRRVGFIWGKKKKSFIWLLLAWIFLQDVEIQSIFHTCPYFHYNSSVILQIFTITHFNSRILHFTVLHSLTLCL